MSFCAFRGAARMAGLPVIINLDTWGTCWRDADTGYPQTHPTQHAARKDARKSWRDRSAAYRRNSDLDALRGERADQTFAGTLQAEGSVLLTDSHTTIPAQPD